MLEKVMQKIAKIIKLEPESKQHQRIIKKLIKQIMETTRIYNIWLGGVLRPRNTSKFKDNSSEDSSSERKTQVKVNHILQLNRSL